MPWSAMFDGEEAKDGCRANFVGVIGNAKVCIFCCWPNVFLHWPTVLLFWPLQLANHHIPERFLPASVCVTSKYYDQNHGILQCRELGWVGTLELGCWVGVWVGLLGCVVLGLVGLLWVWVTLHWKYIGLFFITVGIVQLNRSSQVTRMYTRDFGDCIFSLKEISFGAIVFSSIGLGLGTSIGLGWVESRFF